VGIVGVIGVAGVAITLLRLVRKVGKNIGNVYYKEGVGRGGGFIAILKYRVAIETR